MCAGRNGLVNVIECVYERAERAGLDWRSVASGHDDVPRVLEAGAAAFSRGDGNAFCAVCVIRRRGMVEAVSRARRQMDCRVRAGVRRDYGLFLIFVIPQRAASEVKTDALLRACA